MPTISTLALEILQEIFLYVEALTQNAAVAGEPSVNSMRMTCKVFDAAIQPITFSTITFDFFYARLPVASAQLTTLATTNGPWQRFATVIKLKNLDPCLELNIYTGEGYHFELEDLDERGRDEAVNMMKWVDVYFEIAMKSLKNVRSVIWCVRHRDPLPMLFSCFATFNFLESVKIIFMEDAAAAGFSFNSFSNLRRIHILFLRTNATFECFRSMRDNLRQIQALIMRCPSLTYLTVARAVDAPAQEREIELLFTNKPIDNPFLSSLQHLRFSGFSLGGSPQGVPIHELKSLQSLDLTSCKCDNPSLIWLALQRSTIRLSAITCSTITFGLLDYMMSYSGLTSIYFNLGHTNLVDESETLAEHFFITVLPHHRSSLVAVKIRAPFDIPWCMSLLQHNVVNPVGRFTMTSVRCQKLEELAVTLHPWEVVNYEKEDALDGIPRIQTLLSTASSLSFLRSLTIHLGQISGIRDRRLKRRLSWRAKGIVRDAIQNFKVPQSEQMQFRYKVFFEGWEFRQEPIRRVKNSGKPWVWGFNGYELDPIVMTCLYPFE